MERTKQGQRTLHYRVCLALTAGMFSIMPVTQALPQQGSYDNSAAATIAATADTMNIAGKADNNVLNWLAFSIAKGETVNFDSKNYLNIVNGTTASEIYGALNGSGSIYLVNPNGILFGSTAQVNVGNLIASTRPLSELDTAGFTANGTSPILNHVTDAGRVTGDIVNMGRLQAKSVIIEGNAVSFQNTADITSDGTSKLTGTKVSIQAKDEVHVGYEASGMTNRTFYENGAARTVAVHDYANDTAAAASASTLGYTVNDLAGTAKPPVNYLLVDNVYDLQNMDSRLAGSYMLAGDIDAAATGKWSDSASYGLEGFKPVGTWVDYSTSKPFTGRLDGMNHNIRGLIINRTCAEGDLCSYNGLFGVASQAIIQNVNLLNCDITGVATNNLCDLSVGGLVGYASGGKILNSVVSGQVKAEGNATNATIDLGGIVGEMENGNIETVHNSGHIILIGGTNQDSEYDCIGGVIGTGRGVSVYNAYNSGLVEAEGVRMISAGGIIGSIRRYAIYGDHYKITGYINSQIRDSTNAGGVSITNMNDYINYGACIGGIAGNNEGILSNVRNSGKLLFMGTAGEIGGIAGGSYNKDNIVNIGVIEEAYNTGKIEASVSRSASAGGIAGTNSGKITKAWNGGDIEATVDLSRYYSDSDEHGILTGGIVGTNSRQDEEMNTGSISQIYNTGNIEATLINPNARSLNYTGTGGIAGINAGVISNAYSTGRVQDSISNAPDIIGGIIGNNFAGVQDENTFNGSISQAVYANDIAGTAAAAIGQNTGTVSNVTGRTLAGMKQAAVYMDWDIAATGNAGKTWRIYEGNTTPLLTCFLQGPVTVSGLSDQTAAVTEGARHGDIRGAVYTPALRAEQISGHVFAGGGSAAGTYSLLYSDQLGYDLVNSNTYTLQGTAAPAPMPAPTHSPSELILPLVLPSTTYQNYQEIKGKVRPVVDNPALTIGYGSDHDILQAISGGIKMPTEAEILHTTDQLQDSQAAVIEE